MTNFLEETLYAVNGREVLWVGQGDEWMTWEDFKQRAHFEYYNGFGGEEINTNLMIVGSDWWLVRHEYDGSEWWSEYSYPLKPDSYNRDLCMLTEWGKKQRISSVLKPLSRQ